MTKIKKLRIGLYGTIGMLCLVVVITVGVVVSAFNSPANTVMENVSIENFNGASDIQEPTEEPLGALVGPLLPYDYIGVGGLETYQTSVAFTNNATTTVCSIASPNATSTLVFASFNQNVATATTMKLEIGKEAANRADHSATSTEFGEAILTANILSTALATTTPTRGEGDNLTFRPGTMLNFNVSGGGSTGIGYGVDGHCTAIWRRNSY
jgi:hypothetical protein